MTVSLLWLALMASAVLWELYTTFVDPRRIGITRIGAAIGRHQAGRLLLVAGWAFIGWHLFARYTLPR
jgi:uncharacterized protein DUF6186